MCILNNFLAINLKKSRTKSLTEKMYEHDLLEFARAVNKLTIFPFISVSDEQCSSTVTVIH
jgi:hypothetical protein